MQERLTARELEILSLIARGLSNREIAERLYISTETVKWYNKRLYAKLLVSSRTRAVARARKLGLFGEPGFSTRDAPHQRTLPAPLTSFVGREQGVLAVRNLLMTSRLLTLTGPGGVGKTRLALQVAAGLADYYPDGVTFVGLASIDDPSLVIDSIAHTFGVGEQPDEPLPVSVRRFLAGKQLLLLLDNFEHLLSGARPLASLLAAAPQLSILVTSREPLHLDGEQQYPVDPLELPPVEANLQTAGQTAAVQLFRERARSVKPSFELDARNLPAVAEICTLLDGLPLAIELAAARTRLLSPEALLSRLQGGEGRHARTSGLQLLSSGAPNLPARQQTLRATIDWSYHLLEASEQALFRRLSVFAGGCTLEAVEAVCVLEGDRITVIDLLSSLVDKNLLRAVDGLDGEPRLSMLHTIREYARERLEQTRERELVRDRHLFYFLAYVEEGKAELSSSTQYAWLNRLEVDHENVRIALEWALRSGNAEALARLSGALGVFWGIRGYLSEGHKWLSAALAQCAQISSAAVAEVLFALGWLAFEHGDYVTAKDYYGESHSLMAASGRTRLIAELLERLGHVAQQQGNFQQAVKLCEESLFLYQANEDLGGIAAILNRLGRLAELQGDLLEAARLLEESLAMRQAIGDERGMAASLNSLAELARYQGEYAKAQSLYEQSLALCSHLADKRCVAGLSHNLAYVALHAGDRVKAFDNFQTSLALYDELDNSEGVALCLAGFGAVYGAAGDVRRAVRLLSVTTRLLEAHNIVMTKADQAAFDGSVAELRATLDETSFTQDWAIGQLLSREGAIAEALTGI